VVFSCARWRPKPPQKNFSVSDFPNFSNFFLSGFLSSSSSSFYIFYTDFFLFFLFFFSFFFYRVEDKKTGEFFSFFFFSFFFLPVVALLCHLHSSFLLASPPPRSSLGGKKNKGRKGCLSSWSLISFFFSTGTCSPPRNLSFWRRKEKKGKWPPRCFYGDRCQEKPPACPSWSWKKQNRKVFSSSSGKDGRIGWLRWFKVGNLTSPKISSFLPACLPACLLLFPLFSSLLRLFLLLSSPPLFLLLLGCSFVWFLFVRSVVQSIRGNFLSRCLGFNLFFPSKWIREIGFLVSRLVMNEIGKREKGKRTGKKIDIEHNGVNGKWKKKKKKKKKKKTA